MASTLGGIAMIVMRIQDAAAHTLEPVHRLDENISGTGLKRHTLPRDLAKDNQLTGMLAERIVLHGFGKNVVGFTRSTRGFS